MTAVFQLAREGAVLRASGALTFETAASALRDLATALAAGGAASQLDLAGIEHSDSAGLACILAAQAEALRCGRTLAVRNLPDGMRALARVCEVEPLLAA